MKNNYRNFLIFCFYLLRVTFSLIELHVDTGRRGYMDCVPINIGCCSGRPLLYCCNGAIEFNDDVLLL